MSRYTDDLALSVTEDMMEEDLVTGDVAIEDEEQGMFEHFCISAQQIRSIQCLKKTGRDDHLCSRGESSHFIFATIKINACLSPYRGIHHGQEGCGNT